MPNKVLKSSIRLKTLREIDKILIQKRYFCSVNKKKKEK